MKIINSTIFFGNSDDLTWIPRSRNCRKSIPYIPDRPRYAIFAETKGEGCVSIGRDRKIDASCEGSKNLTLQFLPSAIPGYEDRGRKSGEEKRHISIYKRQDSAESSFSPGYWLSSNVIAGGRSRVSVSMYIHVCMPRERRIVVSNLDYPLLLFVRISYPTRRALPPVSVSVIIHWWLHHRIYNTSLRIEMHGRRNVPTRGHEWERQSVRNLQGNQAGSRRRMESAQGKPFRIIICECECWTSTLERTWILRHANDRDWNDPFSICLKNEIRKDK